MQSPNTLVQPKHPARRPIVDRRDEPAPQEVVLGRYKLLERLGAGGFGVVWRAHDEMLHREVAVKRVWLGAGGDVERAEREALAAARLSHPAIVALYEACAVDDAFYLISELVDGDVLARLIAHDALQDHEALDIGRALCGALEHAHARGVIHRDIKPHNVLVPGHHQQHPTDPGTLAVAAKLTDFGGASLIGEDALTRTGDVLGTLAYMAPEQCEGREVCEEADLYSLALVVYEMLAGVNPVRGATPAATARRIGGEVESLERHRADLSADLLDAVDRALSPHPAERGTIEDLREALDGPLEWPAPPARGAIARTLQTRPVAPGGARANMALPARSPRPPLTREGEPAGEPPQPGSVDGARHAAIALPRAVWIACAGALIAWQAINGRPGIALLIFAALAPLLVLPGERSSSRLGVGWCACALAPVLGLVGLAGAYPAIAGQASRWRERAALGALGYWWLVLAEPLAHSASTARLWLGQPAATPARAVWEGSLVTTATDVIAPLLVLGVLLGAVLWGVGSALLPWIVRGRNAALDLVAVTVWSALLAAAAPMLDGGLQSGGAHVHPRGVVLGAVLGGVIAVAARALRGPA